MNKNGEDVPLWMFFVGALIFLGVFVFFLITALNFGQKGHIEKASEVVTVGSWTVMTLDYFTGSMEKIPHILSDFEKQNPQRKIKKVDLVCLSGSNVPRIFIWHTNRDESVGSE